MHCQWELLIMSYRYHRSHYDQLFQNRGHSCLCSHTDRGMWFTDEILVTVVSRSCHFDWQLSRMQPVMIILSKITFLFQFIHVEEFILFHCFGIVHKKFSNVVLLRRIGSHEMKYIFCISIYDIIFFLQVLFPARLMSGWNKPIG